MRFHLLMLLGAIAASCLGSGPLLAGDAAAQPAGGRRHGWEQQADQAVGGRGLGRQLMTEEEWQAHRKEMQTLTGEERERARQKWHEQMQLRAKERGVTLPSTPGPHGRGRAGCPGPGPCPGPPAPSKETTP